MSTQRSVLSAIRPQALEKNGLFEKNFRPTPGIPPVTQALLPCRRFLLVPDGRPRAYPIVLRLYWDGHGQRWLPLCQGYMLVNVMEWQPVL
jgi:hypothetical protein